ncbi:hypothetical protein CRX42_21925 [Pseudomonas jessenii]|jgi:hypothetical protein|uniref:Uncharacterized protein n=1 Tax=Pseudomonas jessenii TaxID=77298 RepID=A0A2W0EK41_PSEJE|nr:MULTISPECIES: hypothetical protein [Pseudomonas]PYY68407.1 hypothetical protein CRX42_21925 [Pseudomonas jessenii]WPN30121.1 hypothetical protein QMK54_30775 [Pseudomonas sp. P5_109]
MTNRIVSGAWTAQNDRMPGAASLRVSGNVTVTNSAHTPTLVRSEIQDKSCDLRLDLQIDTSGTGLTVLTEKPVKYKSAGVSSVTSVSIFHEGKLLAHINNVLITD